MARWNAIGYCVVSGSLDDAQRADHKNRDGNGKENWQRTKRLKLILQRSPFSYKKVWGEYEGNAEVSYAIFPVSKDGERIGFDKLETFAKSLGNCFQQDTILVRKPDDVGGDTYYINAKTGEKDMEFENLSFDVDPASDFSTNVRNPKKPSHANHYFKYENIEDDSPRMNERKADKSEEDVGLKDYLHELDNLNISYQKNTWAKKAGWYHIFIRGTCYSFNYFEDYFGGLYKIVNTDNGEAWKGAGISEFKQDILRLAKNPKITERRIAFYEKDDKIQDYLEEIEERGLTSLHDVPNKKHPTYAFRVMQTSPEATLTYYGNGFYELEEEDMIFKGATLADFEMDLKQLLSVYESSDNSSPRMRESTQSVLDLAEKISEALGLGQPQTGWWGAGQEIKNGICFCVKEDPTGYGYDSTKVVVGKNSPMSLTSPLPGDQVLDADNYKFDKLIEKIKSSVKVIEMAMSSLKDKLQEIVDFCQKQGYAGFVWNNG